MLLCSAHVTLPPPFSILSVCALRSVMNDLGVFVQFNRLNPVFFGGTNVCFPLQWQRIAKDAIQI